MVNPDDLDVYGRITGHRTLSAEFEAEYAIWLKMHHRNKRTGGLGDLMIPLMRSLGIGPKEENVRTEDRIDWRKVQPMTRVIVTTDTGPRLAAFVGLRDFGILAVRFDNDPMIREAEPYKVTLISEEDAAAIPAPPAAEEPRAPEPGPMEPMTAKEEIETYIPEKHDPSEDELPDAPKMGEKEWYQRAEGSSVYVQDGEDVAEGMLVRIGPKDGEITVWLEGEDSARVFAEADVTVG